MTILLITLSFLVIFCLLAVTYFYMALRVLKHDFALAIQSIAKLNPQDVASASEVARVLVAHEHQFQLHANWQKEVTDLLAKLDTNPSSPLTRLH